MKAQFAALEAQVAALNAQMARTVTQAGKVNPAGYQQMSQAMQANSKVFRNAALSTGMFEAQQLRLNSATDEYTKKLQKQKISFREWHKNAKLAKAAYREQLAMQSMVVKKMPGTIGGKGMVDVVFPTQAHKDLDTLGNKFGWFREQVRSASTQMVNWGKNTQWAGRQLMVGFTMPVVAFGAATGALAYQIDKQMTRIKKVYDTTADASSKNLNDIMAVQKELAQVEADSLRTATIAAQQYGAAAQDTLAIQADLAATGLTGVELQGATNEVMRIATLGEMDHQDALQATITLQSVFRQSTEELAESFNYMNAVENATSLQLADFAKAIPIASAPIKQMGGDIEELGVLLTAMKERGIGATEGANAIKASMQRLFRPSKQIQQEFAMITRASIIDIKDRNKGNLTGMLQDIYEVTKDLSAQDKTKVFAGLFGSYQVTRMSALINGMGDLKKGIGQVSDAYNLAQQDSSVWADTAARETKRMAESISGQFQIALQTLKIEMSQMGEPFLEIATSVLKVFTKIANAFNSLPDGTKKIIAYGMIFGAMIGPAIMLVGLFANLIGNILKFGVAITGVFTKLEILDRESRAAQLAANLAADGFTYEATAVQKLAAELALLTKANQAATLATQQRMAAASGMPMPTPMTGVRHGPIVLSSVGGIQGGIRNFGAPIVAPTPTPESKASSRSSAMFGGSMIVASAAMATMAVSSNKVVDDISMMVMLAATLGPMLAMMPWKAMGSGIASAAVTMKSKLFPAITTAAGSRGIGLMLLNFAKFAGPTGLIVGAIAGMVYLHSKIDDNAQAIEKLSNSGEKWAKIFDYTPTAAGESIDPETGEKIVSLTQTVRQLKKEAPEVGEAIARTMDKSAEGFDKARAEAIAMNQAIREGIKVMQSGGTAENARTAVEAALMAGIGDRELVTSLMARVDTKVDFKVDKSLLNEEIQQTINQVTTAATDAVAKTRVEAIFGLSSTDLSAGSVEAAKAAAKTFLAPFEQATDIERAQMVRRLQENFEVQREKVFKAWSSDPKAAAIMEKYGLNKGNLAENEYDMSMNTGKFAGKNAASDVDYLEQVKSIHLMTTELGKVNDANWYFTQTLAKGLGYSEGQVKNMQTLEALLENFNTENLTLAEAQERYDQALYGVVDKNKQGVWTMRELNGIEKLRALNQIRLLRGQQATGELLDGFGPKTRSLTDEQVKQIAALDRQNDKYKANNDELRTGIALSYRQRGIMASISMDDMAGQLKNAMGSYQQGIADATTSAFDSDMNAALDGIEKDGDRRMAGLERKQDAAMDNFDKRWENRTKAVENHFDARIKALQDQIDAEEKADAIRQKLFDAEMARIDRLNEMANRNVDFNAALNSGDFDEAAKIRNDAEAAAAGWALEDAAAGDDGKGKDRIDKLQDKIDRLGDLKDKRLEHLKEIEDAERDALERTQKRRQDAIKADVDATVAGEKEKWDAQKKRLDEALSHFLGYTATSDKDLRNHMKIWKDRYGEFNLVTEGMFDGTTKHIREYLDQNLKDSRREFANAKDWQMSGARIANNLLQGAFGMSTDDFKQWLTTGVWPDSAEPPTVAEIEAKFNKRVPGGTSAANKNAGMLGESRHEGGEIGTGGGSRKGYARNSPMSRNERMVLAEKGEFMVNKRMASKHHSVLEDINSGRFGTEQTGVGGAGMGFAGLMGALMAKAVFQSLAVGIASGATTAVNTQAAAAGASSYSAGKAGTYGDISFDASQLANASTIASVGTNMGMSARDIQIGIMTSIAESMLRNVKYGDRDSQGLFQQRPSQGWGTVEQVTDPTYAATKFFSELKKIEGRGGMSPWEAAQAVQRSAFSDGSNYQVYWDEAKAIFGGFGKASNSGTGNNTYAPGSGGWHVPSQRGYSWRNTHDYGTPIGTPLYAVSDGTIVESRAITSGGSAGNGLYSTPYRSYGETVAMRTSSGDLFRWAHMNPGTRIGLGPVKGGTMIGRSGNTGNSSGPHVHMDVNGNYDALGWLRQHGIGLKTGGFTTSEGLANLHKNEVVISAERTKKLYEGLDHFASGGTSTYNVNVNVTRPDATADEIVAKTIVALKRIESRKPQSRRA